MEAINRLDAAANFRLRPIEYSLSTFLKPAQGGVHMLTLQPHQSLVCVSKPIEFTILRMRVKTYAYSANYYRPSLAPIRCTDKLEVGVFAKSIKPYGNNVSIYIVDSAPNYDCAIFSCSELLYIYNYNSATFTVRHLPSTNFDILNIMTHHELYRVLLEGKLYIGGDSKDLIKKYDSDSSLCRYKSKTVTYGLFLLELVTTIVYGLIHTNPYTSQYRRQMRDKK